MSFRKLIRTLHLVLGLSSGLVIFTVAITGSIYCFEAEIRSVLYRDLNEVPSVQAEAASVESLIAAVRQEHPGGKLKSLSVPAEAGRSVQVNLKNKTQVFLDPFRGLVLGSIDMETEFFAVVLQIHRSLLLGDTGKMIIGISALVFLCMLITGIVLWWPRNGRLLKMSFRIGKGASGKRRIYDLHSVLGFYAAWVLLFSALTGLIWTFKWAEKSMYWLSGSEKIEKKYHSNFSQASAPDNFQDPADRILRALQNKYPGKDLTIHFPDDSVGVYRAVVNLDNGGMLRKNDFLVFDQYTGQLLNARLYDFASRGDKIKAANYNIHTGKIFGLPGQILIFFAALIAASLPVTGFLIWFNKGRGKTVNQKAPKKKKLAEEVLI